MTKCEIVIAHDVQESQYNLCIGMCKRHRRHTRMLKHLDKYMVYINRRFRLQPTTPKEMSHCTECRLLLTTTPKITYQDGTGKHSKDMNVYTDVVQDVRRVSDKDILNPSRRRPHEWAVPRASCLVTTMAESL